MNRLLLLLEEYSTNGDIHPSSVKPQPSTRTFEMQFKLSAFVGSLEVVVTDIRTALLIRRSRCKNFNNLDRPVFQYRESCVPVIRKDDKQ